MGISRKEIWTKGQRNQNNVDSVIFLPPYALFTHGGPGLKPINSMTVYCLQSGLDQAYGVHLCHVSSAHGCNENYSGVQHQPLSLVSYSSFVTKNKIFLLSFTFTCSFSSCAEVAENMCKSSLSTHSFTRTIPSSCDKILISPFPIMYSLSYIYTCM